MPLATSSNPGVFYYSQIDIRLYLFALRERVLPRPHFLGFKQDRIWWRSIITLSNYTPQYNFL